MGSSETAGALPEPPADGDVDAELPQAARPAAIAAAMVNARIFFSDFFMLSSFITAQYIRQDLKRFRKLILIILKFSEQLFHAHIIMLFPLLCQYKNRKKLHNMNRIIFYDSKKQLYCP